MGGGYLLEHIGPALEHIGPALRAPLAAAAQRAARRRAGTAEAGCIITTFATLSSGMWVLAPIDLAALLGDQPMLG